MRDVPAAQVSDGSATTKDVEAPAAERAKDPQMVDLGRRGGLKGGRARANRLTPERRREIARIAAAARWGHSTPVTAEQSFGAIDSRSPRRRVWTLRLAFPETLLAGLGWGTELWQPVKELPGYERYMTAARADGLVVDPRRELTGGLLPEVVHAASVIEYTVEKIEAIAAEIQAWVTDNDVKADPTVPTSIGHPAVWTLYVEMQNLVFWTRALTDRLHHEWRGSRFGLIPSLKRGSPLQVRATRLAEVFQIEALESRILANLTLHSASLPFALGNSVPLEADGIRAPYPDPVAAPVDHPIELTFETQRDAVAAARQVRDAASELVEGLLEAFEQEAPERLRKPVDATPYHEDDSSNE